MRWHFLTYCSRVRLKHLDSPCCRHILMTEECNLSRIRMWIDVDHIRRRLEIKRFYTSFCEFINIGYLRQFSSSEPSPPFPSLQSSRLLHTFCLFIHFSLLAHRNSYGLQTMLPDFVQFFSSPQSQQSFSPSQSHDLWTQAVVFGQSMKSSSLFLRAQCCGPMKCDFE